MLRVIKRLKENTEVTIKATFLGAHALPKEFKNNKEGYMDLVINEMLPKVAAEVSLWQKSRFLFGVLRCHRENRWPQNRSPKK
jgi:imidazolonepropionase-like amidohydrolase